MTTGTALDIELLPGIREIPSFDESAPTFAENAAGKALYYTRHTTELVLADDSGLVVPALGGAPGVRSGRYAGPGATDADNVQKLLREMQGKEGDERRARFVCVIAIARMGRALVIASDCAEGVLAKEPRGENGFGYDPIFRFSDGELTYAEVPSDQKNRHSHRGGAFRKVVEYLALLNC